MTTIDDRDVLYETSILALSNAHASETSLLTETSLAQLLDMAFYARGVDRGRTAFLIALEQGADYWSPNFHWFREARERFVYIDRIIVADSARGQGIARLLYEDLFEKAKAAGHHRIVCEVNLEPPNPASEAFHRALGFASVGQASIHNGAKIVCYLEKELP